MRGERNPNAYQQSLVKRRLRGLRDKVNKKRYGRLVEDRRGGNITSI